MLASVTTSVPLQYSSLHCLTLKSDEVHVWFAKLNQPSSQVISLHAILAMDERARAERFYFQRHRDQFIVAHGLLRVLLGGYLGSEPGHLRFCCNPYGKPALTKEFRGDTLRFNMSHSHGLALYAFALNRRVGVDLERVWRDLADAQIAERFFSPCEVSSLRALPAHQQEQAFFNCWTRKEAYVKAMGKGLSLPLNQFDVSLRPGEPAMLLGTAWDPQEASRWSMQELHLGPAYVGALCVEGHGWQLKRW